MRAIRAWSTLGQHQEDDIASSLRHSAHLAMHRTLRAACAQGQSSTGMRLGRGEGRRPRGSRTALLPTTRWHQPATSGHADKLRNRSSQHSHNTATAPGHNPQVQRYPLSTIGHSSKSSKEGRVPVGPGACLAQVSLPVFKASFLVKNIQPFVLYQAPFAALLHGPGLAFSSLTAHVFASLPGTVLCDVANKILQDFAPKACADCSMARECPAQQPPSALRVSRGFMFSRHKAITWN